MADAGVTATGLKEMLATIEQLPETVTSALKSVAQDTANRVLEGYRQRLLSQTKAHKTAASAHVIEELDKKRYVVNVPGDPEDPPNLAYWLEKGTSKMAAKPALRPSGDAENDRYKRDMGEAATQELKEALK